MKILLIGPQGSGKGTIAKILAGHLNLPAVSAGEILRSLDVAHPNYVEITSCTDQGLLVPAEIMKSVLQTEFAKEKYANGYILDGWGRRMADIQTYDPNFDKVIVLEISRETSIKRISGRRICSSDGQTYNIYTLPKEELAKCQGELVQREDDTEEATKKRLEIYYTQTVEVIRMFDEQGKTLHVSAENLPNEIVKEILQKLDFRKS